MSVQLPQFKDCVEAVVLRELSWPFMLPETSFTDCDGSSTANSSASLLKML